MYKAFEWQGVGNALVDVSFSVDREFLRQRGYVEGTSSLIPTAQERDALIASMSGVPSTMCGGGSIANSTVLMQQLGATTAFTGKVADDQHGTFFAQDLKQCGVHFDSPIVLGGSTGISFIFYTPGDRTPRTFLGVASGLHKFDLQPDTLRESTWLGVEAYLLAAGKDARRAVFDAVSMVEQAGGRIAFTLSDVSMVRNYPRYIKRLLPHCDLLFANSSEARALTGAATVEQAFQDIKFHVPNVVVTAGSKGAFIYYDGSEALVPAFSCTPIDTTGAGDAYAAAFLHGINRGLAPAEAGKKAAYMAMKVITQVGARLQSGAVQFWAEA